MQYTESVELTLANMVKMAQENPNMQIHTYGNLYVNWENDKPVYRSAIETNAPRITEEQALDVLRHKA